MQLFIDCDGVLADFEARARIILHEDVNVALRRDEESAWEILRRAEVFRHLQVREDGRKLFLAIRHLNPIILTGCAPGGWAAQQKARQGRGALLRRSNPHVCIDRQTQFHAEPWLYPHRRLPEISRFMGERRRDLHSLPERPTDLARTGSLHCSLLGTR